MSDSVWPKTAAHQAPLSLGFSRQEHWSGLPFPSPMQESEKWKWSCSVVSDSLRTPLTLCDPMDCSLPGSSVHGIFQARVLEWGAIAFSGLPWLGLPNLCWIKVERVDILIFFMMLEEILSFSPWRMMFSVFVVYGLYYVEVHFPYAHFLGSCFFFIINV